VVLSSTYVTYEEQSYFEDKGYYLVLS